jgi:formylmethanofuran dehydrogenase subunit E
MKPEAVGKEVETKIRESVRCSCCNRAITNPKESVRSRQRVMCVACYESLLNPSHHCCCSGAAV